MFKPDTNRDSKRMPLHYLGLIFFRCHVIVFAGEGFTESNVNMRHPGRFTGVIGFANV